MSRDIRRSLLELMAVSACWGLLSAPGLAQPAGEEPADRFDEAVRVQVVNLEVVVTDEEDERVTGLGRDSFRPVPIEPTERESERIDAEPVEKGVAEGRSAG